MSRALRIDDGHNERFNAAIARFGADLRPRMRGDGRLEDRIRVPLHSLITAVGAQLGVTIGIHDEVALFDLRSRPDIALDGPAGRIGYVEIKAPGKGVPPTWRPDRRDREQWERLRALPNLVYTDGIQWALLRRGELVGEIASLSGELDQAGDRLRPTDGALRLLLTDFLLWRPGSPTSVAAVVAEVAPLCRLLREQVGETLAHEAERPGPRPFSRLAREWRSILFPVSGLGDHEIDFADAYAQAVTFALLLARVDGVSFDGRTPTGIAEQLAKRHSLLGEALAILANGRWIGRLSVVDTLIRVVGQVDWARVAISDSDSYATLYERFLGEYDPELRRRSGTYYTPAPVARSMVAFVDRLLKDRLGRRRGFGSEDVVVVDPAMGAGTFLAEVLDNAVSTLLAESGSDATPKSHLRELFAERLIGFELQVAPFAVTELRLHAALTGKYGVDLPRDEPRFLTNALDDPDALPLDFGQLYDVLKSSRERANHVKRDVPVTVVIGNPPWRENARGAAPWLEERRDPARPIDRSARPSMDEFRPPQPKLAYNLSNLWVYFWRWAAWKAFEADDPAGVVALITPSAYLSSAAYAGMRRYLREVADEGWIIDLSPESHRSTVSTRVFPATQQPITIGVFIRHAQSRPDAPASVHYTAIAGRRRDKFAALAALAPSGGAWQDCATSWTAPFRPERAGWDSHPALIDLLPWQQPGVTSNRNWVWGPDESTLVRRWQTLINSPNGRRAALFKETGDRTVDRVLPSQPGVPSPQRSIRDETADRPRVARVGLRSFDPQFIVHDRRVIDRPRPELWQVSGPSQVYLVEQHCHEISDGPGVVFSAHVPGAHYFNNRGGRVLPMWRDVAGTKPNVAPGLLSRLAVVLGVEVTAEDLVAYIAAVVSHGAYTRRFAEELTTPGIRVPLTVDSTLWRRAVELGREVIWLHTLGERFFDVSAARPCGAPEPPEPSARRLRAVPAGDGEIPADVTYEPATETLVLGTGPDAGRVGPVCQEVWDYHVGGMAIVRKWLDSRQAVPRHRRRTSELDDINPTRWTAQFDDELLRLLGVLQRCVALEPRQASLLDEVCASEILTVEELREQGVLPVASAATRPPRVTADGADDRLL